MRKVRFAAIVLIGLAVLGASVHAAAGSVPHSGAECFVCGLCSLLSHVIN